MARKAKTVKVNPQGNSGKVQVKSVQVKTKQAQPNAEDKQLRHAPVNSSVRKKADESFCEPQFDSSVVFTDDSAQNVPVPQEPKPAEKQTPQPEATRQEVKAEKPAPLPQPTPEENAAAPIEFVAPEPVQCLSFFDDPNTAEPEQPDTAEQAEPPKTAQQRREERRAKRSEERKQREKRASDILAEHKEKAREELIEAEKKAPKISKKKEEQRLAKMEQRREKKEKLQESIAAVSSAGKELAKAGSEKLSATTENLTKLAKAGKQKLMSDKKVEPTADRSLQKWKDISIPRRVVMALAVLLTAYTLLPTLFGSFFIGMIPLLCIAIFFFLTAWMWNKIAAQTKWYINLMYKVAAFLIMCGIIAMAFISGKMVSASTHTPPKDKSEFTVIVLGCLIKGDQPSLMLQDRLDTAAAYLKEHPGAYCIVTGGQGENEDYPEAVIMKKYLTEKGISDRRILAETASTSTKENIGNAAALVEGCGLYDRVVIVSDRFHQYRARCVAQETGFEYIYALNTETRWYMALPYWFREMACIVRDWIQGGEGISNSE